MDYKNLDKFVDGYNSEGLKENKDTSGDVFDILEDFKNPSKKKEVIKEANYHNSQLNALGKPKDEYDIYRVQFTLGSKKTNFMNLSPKLFEKIKKILVKEAK